MTILSNTGDHPCSRIPASLLLEFEFSKPTTNVVCCWAVTTIGTKGWIDHFQRPEVLNVAKDDRVILISFRWM